jgi:signal transduction histidine kinase
MHQAQLVEAFQSPKLARTHGCLGLGPSLARAIVELHGGRVDVEALGTATTVIHFCVPAAPVSTLQSVQARTAARAWQSSSPAHS